MRAQRLFVAFGFSLLAGVAMGGACGSTDSSGTGGSGGTCGFPDCITNLAKACVPSGTCMSEGTGSMVNICFANGVKILTTAGMTGANTTITKADGTTTCYSVETTVDVMSMPPGVKYVYKDASGKEVATATADSAGGKLKITCDGKTTEIDTKCGTSGMGGSGGGTMCTMGTCK